MLVVWTVAAPPVRLCETLELAAPLGSLSSERPCCIARPKLARNLHAEAGKRSPLAIWRASHWQRRSGSKGQGCRDYEAALRRALDGHCAAVPNSVAGYATFSQVLPSSTREHTSNDFVEIR